MAKATQIEPIGDDVDELYKRMTNPHRRPPPVRRDVIKNVVILNPGDVAWSGIAMKPHPCET